MVLEDLHLVSFKGFRDFHLRCSQVTCLVGPNNGGKTSILQAIQLLFDIFRVAFGNRERPDFSNVQWQSNPSHSLAKLSLGDPDAIWLHKRTSEPCKISARCSTNVDIQLEIQGRNRYSLDLTINGTSLCASPIHEENRTAIERVFDWRPFYVPPVGAVAPAERFLPHPQLVELNDKGRTSECWRSQLFWLWNDGNKDDFDGIVERIRQYLPDVSVLPPALTHTNPPDVLIQFVEENTTFDISMSGGGLRTLLNLAVVLQFSRSRCLLFDEPDAHLHGSLQKAVGRMLLDFAEENDVQILVASHAPDFITEVPVESLVWIDRTESEARRSDELGRLLADLGALSKADAIRACGADKILFVEGSLDHSLLRELFELSGNRNPFSDPQVIVARLPGGKGDTAHLGMFRQLLREALRLEVAVACITDRDFELPEADEDKAGAGHVLVLALGRKEAENFLLEPRVLAAALHTVAEKRRQQTGHEVEVPTPEQLQSELERIMNQPEVRNTIKYQMVPRHGNSLGPSLDPSTKLQRSEQWFEEHWEDPSWRIKNCPGKRVLAEVRRWCQATFKVTLTKGELIKAINDCPDNIKQVAQQLERHFYGTSS